MPRPDALMVPGSFKTGDNIFERKQAWTALVDPLLEIDREAGEKWTTRDQPGDVKFVTRDVRDTLYFPKTHPRHPQSRYRWEKGKDGIMFGYLVEGAAFEP